MNKEERFQLQVSAAIFMFLLIFLLVQLRRKAQLRVVTTVHGPMGERVKTLKWTKNPESDEEDQAMLMALISRSHSSAEQLIDRLQKTGSEDFMDKYYIGFGDRSIGDCGTAVLVIENVSLIAAKHIQHDQLYRGIESSTRYIDFSSALYEPRFPSGERLEYARQLMLFYEKAKAVMLAKLDASERADPRQRADRLAAIHDVARGFLPAGVSTTVGLKMSLRQLDDSLRRMIRSPMPEVRSIGLTAYEACSVRYKHTFKLTTAELDSILIEKHEENDALFWKPPPAVTLFPSFDTAQLGKTLPRLLNAPVDADAYYPTVQFPLTMDYGCYRDFQRHNSVTKTLPRLTAELGFESWYFERLPAELQAEARTLIARGQELSKEHDHDAATQYCLPLGFKVQFAVKAGCVPLQYILSLRTGRNTHPVLQDRMRELGRQLNSVYPGMFGFNKEADRPAARGSQTIAEKTKTST